MKAQNTRHSEMDSSDFERTAVKCWVCDTGMVDFSLTNGKAVHRKCVDSLQADRTSLSGLRTEAHSSRDQVENAERQVSNLKRERDSFSGFLKAFFNGISFEEKIKHAEEHAAQARREARGAEQAYSAESKAFIPKEALLGHIYDAWPDYPPDWEDRRAALISARGGRCEQCNTSQRLQAHHKVPFWKGGSNTMDNLELLCIDCHGDEHGKDFRREGFEAKHTAVSDKDELIAKAIRTKSKITFMYKKFDEKKGKRRTILPDNFVDVPSGRRQGFTRCVSGHCDLRNEGRRFAVNRMYKVQIVK